MKHFCYEYEYKIHTSRLLPKGTYLRKKNCFLFILRPIVIYSCKTWSTTQGDEEKLLTLKWKIHVPFRLQDGEYKKRKNEDLEMLFNKPYILDYS